MTDTSAYTRYRFLEILPAALIWTTLAGAVTLIVVSPAAAVLVIVGFDLLWFIRVLYTVGLLVVAFARYRQTVRVPWHTRIANDPLAERIWHAVFLPTYGEEEAVLRSTIHALSQVRYRTERLMVVLATEGREAERIRPVAKRLAETFHSNFGAFVVTEHPGNLPGEVVGKGANIAWAGDQLLLELSHRGISIDDVLVTTLDVDTVVHPEYFALLTEKFLHGPHPYRTSWQPIPVFANNLPNTPVVARVVSMATTFWLLGETVRPERLFTFSSHSMSLKTLVEVGFWQRDIVTEDSRIFVQGLLRYDGDYRVVPLYLPVSMDAVHAGSVLATLQALYRQQRRWAYGVENFPFMVWNFAAAPGIPRLVKFRYWFNQLEGVYAWATAPLLIFLLGWIPLRLPGVLHSPSHFLQTAPGVLHGLLTAALVGLAVCASLTLAVLSPAGTRPSRKTAAATVLSWVLFPAAMIVFGSIPAIDATTHLALGRYLGFTVTRKFRPGMKAPPAVSPGTP